MNDKKIVARECRFATYVKSNDDKSKDMHVIKEVLHYDDGSVKPNLLKIEQYLRSYYVTKKGLRNYKSKKEWTDLNDVDEFKSTQRDLIYNVAKSIGTPWFKGTMRDLQESPYIYGTDISSTAIIKQSYKSKWDVTTASTNAVFDTETDVIYGTGQIIMATVSFKDKLITVVQESFVRGFSNVNDRVQKLCQRYLGEIFEKRNIKAEVVIVPKEIDVVKVSIKKAHEWMPDFLSVWNLSFDMNKIIDACERANTSIGDIMSDPSVPPEYRHFKYKEGLAKKTTASGVVISYKPSDRWHSVFAPSSFYWIDAMCAYKKIRVGSPEEKSYSLDAILGKELNISKLKFKEADAYTGLAWHQKMQTDYKLEYIVYNMFDCISMEMLDEKTLDLALSLPMFSGNSDYNNFNSQPKRLADSMHYFCLNNNKVLGSTSGEMKEEEDAETTSLSGIIVMLPSHLVADNGLQIIEENPDVRTNIRFAVADMDILSAYPTAGACFNVSKETTKRELLKIDGLDDRTQRMECINISAGHTNAVEVACKLYSLPTLDNILDEFKRSSLICET